MGDRSWAFWLVICGLLSVALIVLATIALFLLRLHFSPPVHRVSRSLLDRSHTNFLEHR